MFASVLVKCNVSRKNPVRVPKSQLNLKVFGAYTAIFQPYLGWAAAAQAVNINYDVNKAPQTTRAWLDLIEDKLGSWFGKKDKTCWLHDGIVFYSGNG